MNEKYRVSLQIAKDLKSAGFQQDCDAYWIEDDYEDGHYPTGDVKSVYEWRLTDRDEATNFEESYAAPCVGRLGEELPSFLDMNKCNDMYQLCFGNTVIENKSEADARALMWLELKKQGLL